MAGFTTEQDRDPRFRKKWKIRLAPAPVKWGDEGAETTVVIDLMDEAGDGARAEVVLTVNDVEFELETSDKGRVPKRVTRLRLGQNKLKVQIRGMPSVNDTSDIDVEPKLVLTTSEPVLGDDGVVETTVNVTAELALRPIKGADVQLILDGKKYGAATATDDDGRVEMRVKPLAKGERRILAELVGSAVRSKVITVSVKQEKFDPVTDIATDKTVSERTCDIMVTALSARGTGVGLVKMRVHNESDPKDLGAETVDASSLGVLARSFDRKDTDYRVRVTILGTEHNATFVIPKRVIPGAPVTPPPPSSEPETPTPPRETLGERARRAYQSGLGGRTLGPRP